MDLSVVGIGIILGMPMKKGEQFSIHFTPLDYSLVYRVVRCQPCGNISHKVGAEFIHRLGAADTAGSLEQDIDRIRQAILT